MNLKECFTEFTGENTPPLPMLFTYQTICAVYVGAATMCVIHTIKLRQLKCYSSC